MLYLPPRPKRRRASRAQTPLSPVTLEYRERARDLHALPLPSWGRAWFCATPLCEHRAVRLLRSLCGQSGKQNAIRTLVSQDADSHTVRITIAGLHGALWLTFCPVDQCHGQEVDPSGWHNGRTKARSEAYALPRDPSQWAPCMTFDPAQCVQDPWSALGLSSDGNTL